MTCRFEIGLRQSHQAGFSLFELLAVIAVLALLTAIAVPRFGAPSSRISLETEARTLHDVLELAAASALATRRPVPVDFDLEKMSARSGSAVTIFDRSIAVRARFAAGAGGEEGAARIVFLPDGTSSGGTIELARGARRIAVEVDWLSSRVEVRHVPNS